jgi:RNA polymerase sigma factor (TIGR02999 family)
MIQVLRTRRPGPPFDLRGFVASDSSQVTRLLQSWAEGDSQALDRLIPLVYDGLRRIAQQRLRTEPGEPSMNTTGLVHEAYLRLAHAPKVSLRDRDHFLALASRVMRHLLVDQARARKAAKRGGGEPLVELDESIWGPGVDLDAVTELDQALERLQAMDARQSQILEQRYFGGLSLEETAGAVGVSLATVKRELRSARAWLAVELGRTISI